MPSCLRHCLPAVVRLVIRYHLSPSLCRKNLKLNITFYHPQHKPDKPCPCLCASLLTAIITHCGSDIELAHSSGHAAPFMMCPHSTHPLYQQCEGENAKLLLNKRWIQNSVLTVSAYSDRLADDYLSLLQKLLQILKIDRVVVCTHSTRWRLRTQTQSGSFVATCDAYSVFTYLRSEKALFKMPYVPWIPKAAACHLSVFWKSSAADLCVSYLSSLQSLSSSRLILFILCFI